MLATMGRAGKADNGRRPFYLYVDEVHNFLTHQYLEQLDGKVRSAISGNVGTMISSQIGAEDAPILAREFQSVFDVGDLIDLPRYHVYIKMMIDGSTSKPFSAGTLPPPQLPKDSRRWEIVEFPKMKYGRPRAELDTKCQDLIN